MTMMQTQAFDDNDLPELNTAPSERVRDNVFFCFPLFFTRSQRMLLRVLNVKRPEGKALVGREFLLENGPLVVGKAPGSNVRLEYKFVSSRHAVLTVTDSVSLEVRELEGAVNGTFVRVEGNWVPVKDKARQAYVGMQLQFADVICELLTAPQPPPPPQPPAAEERAEGAGRPSHGATLAGEEGDEEEIAVFQRPNPVMRLQPPVAAMAEVQPTQQFEMPTLAIGEEEPATLVSRAGEGEEEDAPTQAGEVSPVRAVAAVEDPPTQLVGDEDAPTAVTKTLHMVDSDVFTGPPDKEVAAPTQACEFEPTQAMAKSPQPAPTPHERALIRTATFSPVSAPPVPVRPGLDDEEEMELPFSSEEQVDSQPGLVTASQRIMPPGGEEEDEEEQQPQQEAEKMVKLPGRIESSSAISDDGRDTQQRARGPEDKAEEKPLLASTSNLDSLPKAALESALRDLGLSVKGSKADLVDRIKNFRQEEAEKPTEKDESVGAKPVKKAEAVASVAPSPKKQNPANMTVPQLKEELKKLGLPVSGNKAELVERLVKGPVQSPAKKKSAPVEDDDKLDIEEEEEAPGKVAGRAPQAAKPSSPPARIVTAIKTSRHSVAKAAPPHPPPPPAREPLPMSEKKAPKKSAVKKKKAEEEKDEEDVKLFDNEEEEEAPKKRQKSAVIDSGKKKTPPKKGSTRAESFWYWAADAGGRRQSQWQAYDAEANDVLVEGMAAGRFRIELGKGRWIDVQSMTQRVTGDPSKRRAVLRSDHKLAGDELKRDGGDGSDSDEEKQKKPSKKKEAAPKKASTKKAAPAKKKRKSEDEEMDEIRVEDDEEEEKAPAKKQAAEGKKKRARASDDEEEEEKKEKKPAAPLKKARSSVGAAKKEEEEESKAAPPPQPKKGRSSVGGAKQVAAAVAASPSPAKHAKKQTVVVGSTGITDEKQLKEIAKLASLGATLSEDAIKCTHLVSAGRVLRTVKMLVAINVGCEIVGVAWVKECLKQGELVDAKDWAVKDAEMEKKFGFKLAASLEAARNGKVFAGRTFYCTENTLPKPDQLKEIIESGGGTVKTALPKSGPIDSDWTIVSIDKDAAQCAKLRSRFSGNICVPEVVLSGVLKQKWAPEQHLLPDQ